MILRRWKGFCLAAEEEALFPRGAEMCGEVFAPLVFLVRRDPLRARGLYPIRDLSELDEPEGIGCLTPSSPAEGELAAFVRAHGAGVLNAAFSRAFSILQAWSAAKKDGLVLTLVGLGDVGGTALLALKLLGRELAKVQIFDPNRAQCRRYEMELNQVLSADGRTLPEVVICEEQDLFRCDLFAFTASRGVPGLDSKVQDVRMAQYEANRAMVGTYARMARQADFTGLFCQISDPVDHLSRSVFLQSNQKETGEFDFAGLLPEQVQGFGLGVMAARCAYYARRLGLNEDALRVYGPHGQGLVCANSCGPDYDAALSARLTEQTRTANLRVRELGFNLLRKHAKIEPQRELGFKPYLAPALSSAAASLLRLVRGQEHYGAVPLGGAYFGCVSRMTRFGPELRREALAPALRAELEKTYAALEAFEY